MVMGLFLPDLSRAACVDAQQTKLRSAPSRSAKVTWVVGKFMPLVALEKKGQWSKVRDLDGEIHWVETRDLSTKYQCVVVKVGASVLRKGPATSEPKASAGLAERYMAFKRIDYLLEEEPPENWYKVVDEVGREAWVQQNHVWRPTTVTSVGF